MQKPDSRSTSLRSQDIMDDTRDSLLQSCTLVRLMPHMHKQWARETPVHYDGLHHGAHTHTHTHTQIHTHTHTQPVCSSAVGLCLSEIANYPSLESKTRCDTSRLQMCHVRDMLMASFTHHVRTAHSHNMTRTQFLLQMAHVSCTYHYFW